MFDWNKGSNHGGMRSDFPQVHAGTYTPQPGWWEPEPHVFRGQNFMSSDVSAATLGEKCFLIIRRNRI